MGLGSWECGDKAYLPQIHQSRLLPGPADGPGGASPWSSISTCAARDGYLCGRSLKVFSTLPASDSLLMSLCGEKIIVFYSNQIWLSLLHTHQCHQCLKPNSLDRLIVSKMGLIVIMPAHIDVITYIIPGTNYIIG